MAIGARPPITVTSGNPARRNRSPGDPILRATGFTPTPAGLGSRKSRSVGRRITTDVGRACAILAGFGCRAMNGRRRGFPGARVMTTSVGHRCRRKRASIAGPASTIGQTVITTSVRTNIAFVATKQFGAPRLESAVVPSERNVTIVNQTTNVTNITYNNTTNCKPGSELRRNSHADAAADRAPPTRTRSQC